MNRNLKLAPVNWEEFIGQERVKDRLRISIDASIQNNRPMGHVLLMTRPGDGKTTLARLIAKELRKPIVMLVPPIKRKTLLKSIVDVASMNGILFIDEIHRMKKAEQEDLLTALEEGVLYTDAGEMVELEGDLMVIAATTEPRAIDKAVLSRFRHQPQFEDYSDSEMTLIVKNMFDRLSIKVPNKHAEIIGRASAGSPRQARGIVQMCEDLNSTDPDVVLPILGITREGLTEGHVKYLHSLKRLEGQAGIDLLSTHSRMPKEVLTDLEELLLDRNYIRLQSKGRTLTMAGLKKMNEFEDPS